MSRTKRGRFYGSSSKACLDSKGAGRTCLATGAVRWLKSVFHSARCQLPPFWAAPLVIDSMMRSRLKLPGFWRCGNCLKLLQPLSDVGGGGRQHEDLIDIQ